MLGGFCCLGAVATILAAAIAYRIEFKIVEGKKLRNNRKGD